jgi:hypothetical protein
VNPKSGKKEATVNITGVDLTNNYPPYTLYRYTIKDDGTPDAGVPIADNIRSLTFRYFTDTAASAIPDATGKTHEVGCGDATKCEVAALPLGNGQYDGANPDTVVPERDTRGKIRSIRMSLVGINPQVDAAYTDTDTAAPHYRKLQVDTVIVPRNLGKHGMKEFNTTLPEAPSIKTVCIGACEATYITWSPPASGGEVDSYNIVYNQGDCTANPLTYAIAEDAGKNLSGYASKATPGVSYRFAVQAVNKYGSATSNCIAAVPINKTTPSAPASLGATGGADNTLAAQANKIQLYWPPTTTNIAAKQTMTCNDSSTQSAATIPWAEKIYYRVYRSLNSAFTPGAAGTTKIIDETSANQPVPSGAKMTVVDSTPANCLSYYYMIEAVNYCVTSTTKNSPAQTTLAESGYVPAGSSTLGQAISAQTPAVPSGLAPRSQSCPLLCDVTFGWLAVNTDTTGAPMNIGRYRLYVADAATGTAVPGSPFTTTTTSFTVSNLDPGNATGYKVTVSALDCIEGAQSSQIIWPCVWDGGTITVTPGNQYGGNGTSGNPWIMQTPDILNVTTANSVKQIDWTVTQNNVIVGSGTDVGPKTNFTVGLPDLIDGVSARVRIALTSASGTCAITQSFFVLDYAPPACALKDQQTDSTVVATSGKNINVTLKNSSTDVLKPKTIIVKWNPGYQNNATLNSITYPKSGGGTTSISAGCSTATAVFDVSSNAASITASQSNYGPIQINFSHNTSITGSNATMTNGSICIVYQSPFGDILSCQIFPNANTCTNLSGSVCQ